MFLTSDRRLCCDGADGKPPEERISAASDNAGNSLKEMSSARGYVMGTPAQLELPVVTRFPLAEFAEGRGCKVPLPDTVAEIAEVIGRGNAVRLVEGTRATGSRKWRRQLYVPGEMRDDHRIVAMIGREAADRLSHSHTNCILELPSCFALRRAYLSDHAGRMASEGGASIPEIARELGVDQKTAKSLLSDSEYWAERLDG